MMNKEGKRVNRIFKKIAFIWSLGWILGCMIYVLILLFATFIYQDVLLDLTERNLFVCYFEIINILFSGCFVFNHFIKIIFRDLKNGK